MSEKETQEHYRKSIALTESENKVRDYNWRVTFFLKRFVTDCYRSQDLKILKFKFLISRGDESTGFITTRKWEATLFYQELIVEHIRYHFNTFIDIYSAHLTNPLFSLILHFHYPFPCPEKSFILNLLFPL